MHLPSCSVALAASVLVGCTSAHRLAPRVEPAVALHPPSRVGVEAPTLDERRAAARCVADSTPAVAAGARACATTCGAGWTFEFALPVWVPSITGTFGSGDVEGTVRRGSRDVGAEFSHVAESASALEFFFLGRGSARKGPWSVVLECYYAELSKTIDWRLRSEDTTGTLSAGIARLHGGWQTCLPLSACPDGPSLAVGPIAGLRGYLVDVQVDSAIGPGLSRSDFWVDPIVGVRADAELSRRLALYVQGDVGAPWFGSGGSSAVGAGLRYRLGRSWSVEAGWEVLDIDYVRKRADGRTGVALHLSGPHLAITYEF